MENLDDPENNAKISDSAYSNSCSNSQSRRSHSSKSTHSGSHSSGSSGYGGKPSTGSSDGFSQPPEKRFKEGKKKKQPQAEAGTSEPLKELETSPEVPQENEMETKPSSVSEDAVTKSPASVASPNEQFSENRVSETEQSTVQIEVKQAPSPVISTQIMPCGVVSDSCYDGFSCIISMYDGVVTHTTSSVTDAIGFPKDMWIGRSFIDFIHPKDRNTFGSQITRGLITPTSYDHSSPASTMFCRIRQHRTLGCAGFDVKDKKVIYMPFQLNISFKDTDVDEGKFTYLMVQAKPVFSMYKTCNEVITNPTPFVMRHISNGGLQYIEPQSIPFLGYLPQELVNECILKLYHPDDLLYIRQIYETIIKEGKSKRSKTYRMLAQNGDYVKLETEWSSFINPWSKKLEFVVGKHYVTEGPTNPDVFMEPCVDSSFKNCEKERPDVKQLKEDIIKILNEVLIKPADVAKLNMNKSCQELAMFMESLLENTPKPDEELRLEIHEPDERDSVMLGGISPHHDNDKSGTETPLSYNQLNYNENLQRYFERHEHHPYNYYSWKGPDRQDVMSEGRRLSPMAVNYGDSGDGSSSGSGPNLSHEGSIECYNVLNNRYIKLTETLLNKHNAEMEKELVKKHRETRTSTKTERERASNETKQKKKEHLARCNVSYDSICHKKNAVLRSHGTKRNSRLLEQDDDSDEMYRASKLMSKKTMSNNKKKCTSHATAVPVSTWATPSTAEVNVQTMTQPVPFANPVAAIPAGMIPIYYVPTAPSAADDKNKTQLPNPVPYIMYPQSVYNPPFVYSPVASQATFPVANQITAHASLVRQPLTKKPFVLPRGNYDQIFEPGPSFLKHRNTTAPSLTSRSDNKAPTQNNTIDQSSSNSSSVNANCESNKGKVKGDREEAVDRTDCESSYSSFYSSFFKTESGSMEESVERKNKIDSFPKPQGFDQSYVNCEESEAAAFDKRYYPFRNRTLPKRKTILPWSEQVSVTSELVYKYQIQSKNLDDVLQSDMNKIKSMKQPNLVNEQLGQLYLDLQLEGVAARLTLEEGITSSGSSAEDANTISSKKKRKPPYNKLVMVYEEDAPLPPPDPVMAAPPPLPETMKDDAPFIPPVALKESSSPSPSKAEEYAPPPLHKEVQDPSLSPLKPEEIASLPPPEPEYIVTPV